MDVGNQQTLFTHARHATAWEGRALRQRTRCVLFVWEVVSFCFCLFWWCCVNDTIVAKIITCSFFSAWELISDYSYSWGGGTELISNYSYSRGGGAELISNYSYSRGGGSRQERT